MKYLSKESIKDKTVLLRCDFNVPVKDGKILDDSKITKSLKTIQYLLDNNNKVIILSHFGRVKENKDKKNNTLLPVYIYLKDIIDIDFIPDARNLDFVLSNSSKKCFLVENTRFTDIGEKQESANNLNLAEYWSNYADVFVIDAFASLHRAHSSTAGISKYLPTFLGFLVEEELKNLEPLVNNSKHPFVVIMGGAKVDDKIKIIEGLIKKCDRLILTGGILNTFLYVCGKNVGKSLISEDETVINSVKNVITNYKDKLYFTDKFVVKRKNEILSVSISEIEKDDIIYDNIPSIKSTIKDSKIVFMNGTCGKYEDEEYSLGTKTILNDLASNENVYIGGGDTVSAVYKYNKNNDFKYLSSGGGATLEYVAYGKLKALEWIKENEC